MLGNERGAGRGRHRHAAIESDELDRVFPKPGAEELAPLTPGARDVSQLNLAALWSTYRALGHSRLIMSGVMLHVGFDKRWILAAIPDAQITVVRILNGAMDYEKILFPKE